jgi:hypothetical protein
MKLKSFLIVFVFSECVLCKYSMLTVAVRHTYLFEMLHTLGKRSPYRKERTFLSQDKTGSRLCDENGLIKFYENVKIFDLLYVLILSNIQRMCIRAIQFSLNSLWVCVWMKNTCASECNISNLYTHVSYSYCHKSHKDAFAQNTIRKPQNDQKTFLFHFCFIYKGSICTERIQIKHKTIGKDLSFTFALFMKSL